MTVKNVDGSLVKEDDLQELIDETIQKSVWETARIHLRHCESNNVSKKDLCTVYTTFDGGYKVRFVFCAERAFMKRIAGNMLGEPVTDAGDIEEYMKEFVNVICGHVVAAVFKRTKTAARFHCPDFAEGCYVPAHDKHGTDKIITTSYIDEYSEIATVLNDKFSFVAY